MLQSININKQKENLTYQVYKVNCKSEYTICLMEGMLYNKQYVGKAETTFNIRLNNHTQGSKNPNAILASRHFQQQGHNFNSHTKFTIIDKLVNTSSSKNFLSKHLIQQENVWIQKLKTLVLYGLNQELSK